MIVLNSEASFRGKGCIAPPKTCTTGRLPKQQSWIFVRDTNQRRALQLMRIKVACQQLQLWWLCSGGCMSTVGGCYIYVCMYRERYLYIYTHHSSNSPQHHNAFRCASTAFDSIFFCAWEGISACVCAC